MGRGLNKVMIIGYVGREPEMRYTPSGRPVTSFSVATSRSWTSAEGERREIMFGDIETRGRERRFRLEPDSQSVSESQYHVGDASDIGTEPEMPGGLSRDAEDVGE